MTTYIPTYMRKIVKWLIKDNKMFVIKYQNTVLIRTATIILRPSVVNNVQHLIM